MEIPEYFNLDLMERAIDFVQKVEDTFPFVVGEGESYYEEGSKLEKDMSKYRRSLFPIMVEVGKEQKVERKYYQRYTSYQTRIEKGNARAVGAKEKLDKLMEEWEEKFDFCNIHTTHYQELSNVYMDLKYYVSELRLPTSLYL